MNDKAHTATKGTKGRECATLFRASQDRHSGFATQPGKGERKLLNENINSMHHERAEVTPTKVTPTELVLKTRWAGEIQMRVLIFKTKKQWVQKTSNQLTDTQGRHVKNTIDSTSITKRTALLKMVENRHFGFTPQKS